MSDERDTEWVQNENGYWEHPNPLVEELSWVIKGWAKDVRYEIAVDVVAALEPIFRKRERAAKVDLLERLAGSVNPDWQIVSDYGECGGIDIVCSLAEWLRMGAATTDTAADRTEGGTE